MKRTLFVLLLAASSAPAFAQDGDEPSGPVSYKERTEIDFEEVDVSGELIKPEGQLLIERKKASFNPLIRFRENWDAEMKQSIDEVK